MRSVAWLRWLLFFASLLAHIHCEEVFGILGENFTFPAKIEGKMVEIIWTKNKDKVVEWEGQNKPTYFTSLQNRGLLNTENGCLTIFNLEKNDTGTYVLEYMDAVKKSYDLHSYTFILTVLDPPSKPEISCNISGDNLVLKCTADFQKPLNYNWNFSGIPVTRRNENFLSLKKNVDASEKVACVVKFSQTEKSSEISLTQCLPDETGDRYHKRSRTGLVMAFLLIPGAGILAFLLKRGSTKFSIRNAAQRNSPVSGSAEHQHRCSVDSREQLNSDRDTFMEEESSLLAKRADDHDVNAAVTSSQAVCYESEKPEADKELVSEDCALNEKQVLNSGVNQGDTSKEEESSLLAKHADDHDVNAAEVTQDAEGGSEDHLGNRLKCSEEDTFMEEESSLLAKRADDHDVNAAEVTQDAEGGSEDHLGNRLKCSEEVTSSQAVGYESEKPEADKELVTEDCALNEKQVLNSGVNQGDTFMEEESSLLAKRADDHDVNAAEVTQDAEGGSEAHLGNRLKCSEEAYDFLKAGSGAGGADLLSLVTSDRTQGNDLKSLANNCFVDQAIMEEKR